MGLPPPLYFNAGMFVFEPSRLTYESLLETLKITTPTPFAEQVGDHAEQISSTCSSKTCTNPFLSSTTLFWQCYGATPRIVELEKVKVVHYCAAGSKPWKYTGKEDNMEREDIKVLVAKWWNIYDDESLDFKPENSVPEGSETFSKPSIMPSIPELAVSYIPAPSAA
ncbi:galactinol synthase 1 [Actinidia rufa]|uniref:Hexosyltransferase n=1 Tax=Actinidia rufa TaxID=165716 RepID=A0A7J0F069_9ERIC|nr:galactinol synthase 1 [Actinidia rufa]